MVNASSRTALIRILAAVVLALASAGCQGSANPAAPTAITVSTGTPAATGPAATVDTTSVSAVISGVLPEAVPPTTVSQTFLVSGANFQRGLTVGVTGSSGATTTVSGSAIQNLTETSFQVGVTLPEAGTYRLSVTNPATPPSPPVTIVANPATTSRPKIAGLSPSSITQYSGSQNVMVAGVGFEPGLSVTLTGPGGTTRTVGGSAIQNVTSTLFQMTVVMTELGNWSMRVANPTGEPSEPWAFVVKGLESQPRPVVTGVSPASPAAGPTAQMFYVLGSGFTSGLSITFTAPSGRTITASGTGLRGMTNTALSLYIVLDEVGTYTIVVSNPSGSPSEPFTFAVKAPDTAARPVVSGLSPGTPTLSTGAQTVYISGTGFQSLLTATFTSPSGKTAIIGGSSITFTSTTVFYLPVMLVEVGRYSLVVANTTGLPSEPFWFDVKALEVPRTAVAAVMSYAGGPPQAAPLPQWLLVQGSGFQVGLTGSIKGPDGTVLGGVSVEIMSNTTIRILATLASGGTCTLVVTNPGGSASEPYSFPVSISTSIRPTIAGLSPRSPVQNAPTMFYIVGANYAEGMSVTITAPSGAVITMSGSQILELTATMIRLSPTFPEAGTHTARVILAGGAASEPWTFDVKAP